MSDPSTTSPPAPAPENDARETYLRGFENIQAAFIREVATIRGLVDDADGHGLAPVVAEELRIRLKMVETIYATSIDMATNLHVHMERLALGLARSGREAVRQAQAKVLTPPSTN
jgi:hypothetical protein